ncbi:hypothetical protein ACLKA6_012615 [Drosophila palustris]
MDSDNEDDYPSSSDVKRNLREIANSRPGTNVAKSILAYNESPSLSTLLLLLEEVSKNTDFSTDLRLSLSYYMDEFLRQVSCPTVPRRSIVAAAGNVLQYCSKIYGDRVELMYQVVEQQIAALLIADPKKAESNNNNGDTNEAKKPTEPRKRRTKKLTQMEFDPFSYKMEPKKFKTMSDEKRFSRVGFETNKNRNRTIEHLYQDHTPAKLWDHEPIIDPDNPYEQDEKKNYKLFTYHPEPRYNTLLPDIPFERLSLIKEYVNTNQVDVSETLNENMTNREYLDEYIALENQMLASRYSDKTGQKRAMDYEEYVQSKRVHVDEELRAEILQKRLLEDTEEPPNKRRHTDGEEDNSDIDLEATRRESLLAQISVDSVLSDPLKALALAETTADVVLDDSQMDEPVLCSTLANNESSQLLESTQESQLNLPVDKEGASSHNLQIDSGLGMEDSSDMLCTAQSDDDEGVVLADNIDEQRLQSLSPKVMVHDILPGVPDKANLSVRVDAELLGLSGINEPLEEIVNVPREVRYEIKLNILQIPQKKLRRECLFKLPKDFSLFKEARLPAKRVAEPREPRAAPKVVVPTSPAHSVSSLENLPLLSLESEFDSEQNFLGFRRLTLDSGIDPAELRAESAKLTSAADINIDEGTNQSVIEEIQQVRASQQVEEDVTLPEIPELDTTIINESDTNNALLTEEETSLRQLDNELDSTPMELEPSGLDLVAMATDEDPNEDSNIINKSSNSIDEETDAKIIDWHRRLAPTLEAAHERQNFSIQDLNDEIIRKCQERNGEATLADVLEDKDETKLCCYMLSSLLLTNQGNVSLNIDNRDKSKPIEMHQFKMKLISTERKQLNPEDDIGNMRSSNSTGAKKQTETQTVNSKRGKACYELNDSVQPVKVKTVRLIKPVPKSSARAEDSDSGISSLPASLVSNT